MTHRHWAGMLAVLGSILITLGTVRGESLYSTMGKGSHLYEQGSYDEALKSFVDAQIESPENPRVKYNVASTHYQMKNYEEAIKNYQDVAATAQDIKLEEQSLYNIGNCLYRQGKLEESLGYYQKALDLDPDDQDAKYNLEFVREEIKKRINEAKQREQEQQNKNKEDGECKQPQQQNQHQQQGQQRQQPQEEQQQAQQNRGEEEGPKPQEEQKEQAMAGGEEQQPPRENEAPQASEQAQERQMTEEEAENWLRGVKEGKRDYTKQEKGSPAGSYRPAKDW